MRLASKGKYSNKEIIKQRGWNASKKTISNTIRQADKLQYAAKLDKTPLSALHKMQLLSFTQETMTWDDQWLYVFSPMKKNGK